jgi:hypothetical protein
VKKKMSIIQNLPDIVAAIGGLGTAAFGLVDATKPFAGGVNRIGFKRIEAAVKSLTPGAASSGLTQDKILATLRANWYNGKDLASQKAIAKSLIKVSLNSGNAATLSKATGVDAALLKTVAEKIVSGSALQPNESDAYARFDFILTALLDEVYQHSDQAYTNGTRILAFGFSLLLAFLGGWSLNGGFFGGYLHSKDLGQALLVGLLATPLAPIAKDLSSALATAVNTMQLVKK